MGWFSNAKPSIKPLSGEIEEAKRWPNGHVYRIAGNLGPRGAILPDAIAGAWKVDGDGKIIGDFNPNKNFDPTKWRS